jgi:pimeloyl-ACP methyl ester carboxylesterase
VNNYHCSKDSSGWPGYDHDMTPLSLFVELRGAGRPLVFLHGAGVDHRFHLPLDQSVAAIGRWQRWYLDLPGFGQSLLPDSIDSSQALADALVGWLRVTLGDEPFALVGSSFGGLLARYVASQMPGQVLGLALLCPVVGADRSRRTLPPRRVAQADPVTAATAPPEDWASYAEFAVVESADGWRAFRQYVLPALKTDCSEVIARLESSYDLARPPEAEGWLTQPTLILCGRDDQVVGYQDQYNLLAHYPAATYVVLADAGHNAGYDQPQIVAANLTGWLQRIAD